MKKTHWWGLGGFALGTFFGGQVWGYVTRALGGH